MKTVLLKGVEIKIGSRVRYVNDTDLYVTVKGVIKPELGQVYTVRDINDLGGFLLKEIRNTTFEWYSPSGELDYIAEPGFANWRFEPGMPALKLERKKSKTKSKPQVKETVDVPVRELERELEPA
jgi:hypothetical protein